MNWLYAGIDTHKDTLAVAVIDKQGRLLAGDEVANTDAGFAGLAALFEQHGVVRVGIEGYGQLRPRGRDPPGLEVATGQRHRRRRW